MANRAKKDAVRKHRNFLSSCVQFVVNQCLAVASWVISGFDYGLKSLIQLGKDKPRLVKMTSGALIYLIITVAGLLFLEKEVQSLPHYEFDPANFRLTMLPAEIKDSFIKDFNLETMVPAMSIFDERLEPMVRQALAAQAWVAHVGPVKKQLPNRLEVPLEIRRPVLKVRSGFQEYLVDLDGVVLPPEPYAALAVDDLPVVVGVGRTRHRVGQVVTDHGVLTACEVMREILEEPAISQNQEFLVRRIDVSNIDRMDDRRPPVILTTDGRYEIRFDPVASPGMVTLDQQVDRLAQVLRRDPQLRYMHQYLDLRFPSIPSQ